MHRILIAMTALVLSLAPIERAEAQGLVRDAEIEETLALMTQPIFDVARFGRDEVQVFILNDRTLNAFVTGGRVMVFHTGLMATLTTPEQLMGVIAHEAGHITGGHAIRRIAAFEAAQRTSLISTVLGIAAAVAGGSGEVGLAAITGSSNIVNRSLLRFTRGQEASADQAALTFMNAAGINPSGMVEVLERLGQEERIFAGQLNPYALTHPLTSERIALLRQGVSRSPYNEARVPDELRYRHARMRAKLIGFLGSLAASDETFGDEELDLYRDAIRLHRVPAPEQALAAVDRLIEMRPDDPYYWELKGFVLAENGRGPEAVAPYREAVRLSGGHPMIRGGLGRALLTLESPEADAEALTVLEQASFADPFDLRLRRSLAIAYARSGNDGMASVITAERLAISGRVGEARSMARRAQSQLPAGSPGWLRAEDVIALRDQ